MNLVIRLSFLSLFFLTSIGSFASDTKNEPRHTDNGFQLPEFERLVLKNGLTLYLMEQHEVPLISITSAIEAGAIKDDDQFGLASLTVDGLKMGTANDDKRALEDLFDFHGANLSSSITPDAATFSLSLAAKDLDTLLPVFLEMLHAPTFPENDTNKLMSLHLQKLERNLERPQSMVHQYFYRMLFGNHAYGNPTDGSKETVTLIKPSDLQAFHQQHYQVDKMAISLVGDFDAKKIKRKIKKLVRKWEGSSSNAEYKTKDVDVHTTKIQAKNSLSSKEGNRVIVVNKEDALETSIRIGGRGIPRSNEDYVELTVVNTILGAGFTSWLMTALRVDAGLTYGVSSRFRPLKQDGAFFISTSTETQTTFQTIDLALSTYQRLLDGKIDQMALDSARNYVVGLFPPRFEKTSDLSAFLSDMYIYNFDESYVNTFEDRLHKLTLTRAQELVQEYFPTDNLIFVLIGRSEMIVKEAKKYGKVYELDITDPIPKQF